MLVTFLPEDYDSAITPAGHPPDGISRTAITGTPFAELMVTRHALQGKQ
jgi:hypothetical protein